MRILSIILLFSFLQIGAFSQNIRELKEISLQGVGFELGFQHGQELKNEIDAIITAWKNNTTKSLKRDADQVVKNFFEYAKFDKTIKDWTPDLYEEIKGIAAGAEQNFNDVFVLNLLDEFWVYLNNLNNHHCSGLGIPSQGGSPSYIAQNMDLENYTDGFQVLMKLNKTDARPEQLILTYPGLIALNGLNETGVGVCVNTLMQLNANSTGLPVAFVIRKIINSTDKAEILSFIKSVNHASGQNYIIGIKGEVYDFEASANKVVRFEPQNNNGAVYHTNHPIVNNDIKPWFEEYNPDLENDKKPWNSNSYQRLMTLESNLSSPEIQGTQLIKKTLKSKKNGVHPICRSNNNNGRGFTFATTIMHLYPETKLELVSGPPDESSFKIFSFTKIKLSNKIEQPD